MHVKDNIQYTVQQQLLSFFQLMTVGLLSTAKIQNLNYRDRGLFETLEVLLHPTDLDILVFGIKLPDISGVT